MTERVLPIANLSPESFLETISTMEFPNDIHTANIYAEILKTPQLQKARVAELLEKEVVSHSKQRQLAGEHVRVTAEALANGLPVSGRRTTFLIGEFSARSDAALKTGFAYSASSAREGFRKFKNVAHLWAAANHMGPLFQEALVNQALFAEFLALSDAFLSALVRIAGRDSEPWMIPEQFQTEYSLGMPEWSDEWIAIAKSYSARGGE